MTAGALFFAVGRKILNSFTVSFPFLSRPYVRIPIHAFNFYLGYILYDKLTGQYLNWQFNDISHSWQLDYAKLYQIHQDEDLEKWTENLALTPFENLKRQIVNQLNKINVEGEKVFRRLSKDRDDVFYTYGKARNLENIIYLNDEELKNIKSPMELQLKLDSVTPVLDKTGDPNSYVSSLHDIIEQYKYHIENSKNFRSVKDKLLGLPFNMLRHRQYPEPTRGTWQYDVYELMFGEQYDRNKGMPENEEKINKYNYHLFLHPSVIQKYDTNSEEFDMYLRQLNIESKTVKESRAFSREYFCKHIMPFLNLAENKEVGYDFANYVMNKHSNDEYGTYLYENYSGQKEERLFREAEESKYLNKNTPFVQATQYSTIDKSRIGIKASELSEILNNPTKQKKLRRAMETAFIHYEPSNYMDQLKFLRRKQGFVDTMIEHNIDPSAPDFDMMDLVEKQHNEPEADADDMAMAADWLNMQQIVGGDRNTYPYNSYNYNMFFYNSNLDWNDYGNDYFPQIGIISPKKRRYELFNKLKNDYCTYINILTFSNGSFY